MLKGLFKNTKRFRVNANGNNLDIWLIYQCEKCKHTYNLAIHERFKPELVPMDEYKCFLANDETLAEVYGRDIHFFRKNKAEVDFANISYHIKKTDENMIGDGGHEILIEVDNPYCLKIRAEKLIAEVLSLSRSQVKKLMDRKEINIIECQAQQFKITIHKENS